MEKREFMENWLFGKAGNEKREICLPHDAMLEEGRSAESESGSACAYFLGGIYEYEKLFYVPDGWKEMDVCIEFEGIYPNAAVYLNDREIGRCAYGYKGFILKLDSLVYGQENKLKVVADNQQVPNSRWYSGAGIYRPVWLWTGKKKHILPDGIHVTTVSCDPAQILVEVRHTKEAGNIRIEILDDGNVIAEGSGEKAEISIPDAKLWSSEKPNLYQCRVMLIDGEGILDVQTVQFGIRIVQWSSNGLFISGESVLLQGGCIHHDNGILGAKCFEKSEWRKIRRLKEFGFNAVRSSHNPISKAALEACDALGMYVMDETWDMWYQTKNAYDYANYFEENYKDDIKAVIEKDYNHPSVIMYSIGNEVTEPTEEKGVGLGKEMIDICHRLDPSRPVTAGINITLMLMSLVMSGKMEIPGEASGREEVGVQLDMKDADRMDSTAYNQMISEMGKRMNEASAMPVADGISSPILDALDIAGYNYASARYEMEDKLHPKRVVVGTETFPYDLVSNWEKVKQKDYLIGDFMWTAWDYIGEAGIGAWTYHNDAKTSDRPYPWKLADTGAFDILGNDNAEAGLASVIWGKRKTPYIGVVPVNQDRDKLVKSVWRGSNALPYWSYKGCEGKTAKVEVYSDAYEIELFVNEKSYGRKQTKDLKAVFEPVYEEGTVRAAAYDEKGTCIAQSSLRSADRKTQIRICPEEELPAKNEILYIDILITGENGEIECNSDTCLSVCVEGGQLLGFGSANPRTEENYLEGRYTTYYGRSQAVVKCLGDSLKISVSGEGVKTAELVM